MTTNGIPSIMAAVAPARLQSTVLTQHIGRVGALAVALGIGIAVVAAPGVAFAEPGTANSSSAGDNDNDKTASPSGDSDKHETNTSSGDTDTAEAPPGGRAGTDAQPAVGADSDVDPDADEDEDEPVDLPDVVDEDDESEPPADADPEDAGADEGTTTPAPPVAVPDPPATVTTAPSDRSHVVEPPADPSDSGGAPLVDDISSTEKTTAPISANDKPSIQLTVVDDTMTTPTVTGHAALRITAGDLGMQAVTAAPVSPIAALIAFPARIVTTVVGVLLSPFLVPVGPAPTSPPLFWAVLGWVQRELQRTFFNRSPVLGQPGDIDQDGSVVTGSVTATDADGDPIAYSVAPSTAQGGTVVVDQQGRFTYVAPQSWNGASALTDTFTVTAVDSGFHVHGLLGPFFGGGHAATRDVTVTLASLAPRETGVTDTWSITAPSGTTRTAVGPNGTLAIASRTGGGTVADPYRVTVRVLRPGQDIPTESSAVGDFTFQPAVTVLADGTVAYSTVDRSAGGVPITTTTVVRPGSLDEVLKEEGDPIGGVYSVGNTGFQWTQIVRAGSPTETRVTVVRGDQPLQTHLHTGDIPQGTQPQIANDGTVYYTLSVPGAAGEPPSTHLVLMRPGGVVTRDGVGLGSVAIGDDGTAVFVDWTGTGAAGDPYVTFLNVLRPGQQASRTPVAGAPGSAVVGPNGTIAYATTSGAGTALDPATTYVTVFRLGQAVVQSNSAGGAFAVQVGPDGTVVYSTIVLANGSAGTYGPGSSTTTVLRPGQSEFTHTAPTAARVYPLLNATGTVVVADVLGSGAPNDLNSTTLTIYRPNATPVVQQIAGPPVSLGLGDDGSVTYAESAGSSTTFIVLRPDGTTETATAPGNPQGSSVVTADGTVVHTTRESGTMAHFTIMRPGEPAVTIATPGLLSNEPAVGPDGTLYQLTDDRVLGRTNLTIVTASGEVTRLDFAGADRRLVIDPDGGKVVLVMSTLDAGVETLTAYEIAVVTGGVSSL